MLSNSILMEKFQLFLSSYSLWGGAVCAGVVIGTICGFLGNYVILHRIVFVSAAMSQVSSFGVMLAFFLSQILVGMGSKLLTGGHPAEDILPLLLAAIFTGLFSVTLAGRASKGISDRSKSSESLIGAAYLLSTAGLLLVGDRVSQGAHDVSNVLFGNAVVVDEPHLILLLAICVPIFIAHLWLKKDILFVSFDPMMATTLGYPVGALRIFLLLSLGVVISIGTRTIGALPVFSFSVLPSIAAFQLFSDLKYSFMAAAAIGGCSAFLGYLASFLFSFPTGACMVAVSGTISFIIWISSKVLRK